MQQARAIQIQSMHYLSCQAVRRTAYLNFWNSAEPLVSRLVLPRLDYCNNAVLAGTPLHLARRLQSVMNAAARLVFASSKCDHIMPLLRQLHWLRVPWWIDYKLTVLLDKYLHGLAVAATVIPCRRTSHSAESQFRRRLRSASSYELSTPGLKIVCSCTLFVQLKLENVQSKRNICAVHF